MGKIDTARIPECHGSGYPAPCAEAVRGHIKQALGDTGGLSDVGVNLTRLPSGC